MNLLETGDSEVAYNAYVHASYFMKDKTPYEYRKRIVVVPGI